MGRTGGESGWENVTCLDFVSVQGFSLYILFILWNIFRYQDILIFEIAYQLLTLGKKTILMSSPKEE